MTTHYRYFCGVDIGKRKHAACLLDEQGTILVKLRFANDAEGFPGEKAMTCRQVTRLWYALMGERTRIKLWLHSKLEWAWPEFENYLANAFGPTGRALLRAAPTPQDLLAMEPAALTELLEKVSRKKLGADLAAQIRASAETSVGMRRGLEGVRTSVRILLDQLDAMARVQERLRSEIETLAAQLPGYLLTLPGVDPIRAVSLFGETDPISTFKGPEQLVAFAGLDLSRFQTGQYEAPRRKISKRGSPHLRHTLWTMAAMAIRKKGELRRFYQKRRKRGLHHLSAVTATALKLTRIVWRICTDQRDYLPAGRPASVHS